MLPISHMAHPLNFSGTTARGAAECRGKRVLVVFVVTVLLWVTAKNLGLTEPGSSLFKRRHGRFCAITLLYRRQRAGNPRLGVGHQIL